VKILLTGATGLIGRKLVLALLRAGHEVFALSRSAAKLPELPEAHVFPWSDDQIPPSKALAHCDVIIHLAGEGIADQRWTDARKKRIQDSRINGTKNLVKAISALPQEQRPKLLISGSAIGYYAQSENSQDENSNPGQDFLANLCIEWEACAKESEQYGLRTVLLRTGLVLAKEGGVLSKTGPIVLGSGQQWMSWIHIDDMVRFILFAIENKNLSGPYNLTAPHPVTNKEFTKAVSQYRGFPLTLRAPKFALNLALGELAEAVLSNQRVLPTKTLSTGFQYQYAQLDQALNNLIGKH